MGRSSRIRVIRNAVALTAVTILGTLMPLAWAAPQNPVPVEETAMDLSQAVVVTPPNLSGPAKKAIVVLIEEVGRLGADGLEVVRHGVTISGRSLPQRAGACGYAGRSAGGGRSDGG